MHRWWRVPARALAATVTCLAVTVVPVGPVVAAPTGEPSAETLVEVEAYLRRHMAELRVPGTAYAVVRADRVVRRGAWGVDGNGRPMTTRTPFVLGSTSKSVTALAVMQLVEAGRVDLDTPVRAYVPWFRVADDAASRHITVRHLLTHTSGLPGVATSGYTDRYDTSPEGLARSVRDLATLRPTTAPGRTYQYSDANYMILGVLVETVTGETFGAYLRRNVLDPLRMDDAAATAEEAPRVGVPPGHRYYFGRPRRFAPPFDTSGVPYGFLAASLDDMSHFAVAQLTGGRYGDAQVLSAAGVTHMHRGQVPTGTHGRYGLGWRDTVLDGTTTRLVWHAGAVASSFSHVVLVPESGLAVIVLANSYSVALGGPLTAAAFNVVRILQGGTPRTTAEDFSLTWALAGLVVVAGLLLATWLWMVVRIVRQRRSAPRDVPSRHRVVAVAVAWVAGCAVVATGAGWALPAMWDGAKLTQVLLFAPDLGHTILAVVTLAILLALTRCGMATHTLLSDGDSHRSERPVKGSTKAG